MNIVHAQSQTSGSNKGQLILKVNFEVFFRTKKHQKYFCISAIASKMGQIIKMVAHFHAN